jgi:hypothetical protein
MRNEIAQIQDIIFDFFQDTPDEVFAEIVNAIAFEKGTDSAKATSELTRFMKENDLGDDYILYREEKQNPPKHFSKLSMSVVEIFNNMKVAFLAVSHNRFLTSIEVKKSNKRIEKALKKAITSTDNLNESQLEYARDKALEILEIMNDNDHFFYGKETDKVVTDILKKMSYDRVDRISDRTQ